MNDDSKRKEDHLVSSWEQQCIDEVESGPDFEQQVLNEKDIETQKMWTLFQNAATSISQLYKDRQQGITPHWVVFQNAAGAVTCLYKESVELQKKTSELGIHCGYQRRNRDIIAWAKKKRRHIRREDLITYLSGKTHAPTGYAARSSPRPRGTSIDNQLRGASLQRFSHDTAQCETDLHTFREAMALSSLNGAMSSISMGIHRPHGSSSPTQTGRHHRRSGSGSSSPNSVTTGSASVNHLSELNTFICEEFSRHLKRPPGDIIMDSPPSQKRPRFI